MILDMRIEKNHTFMTQWIYTDIKENSTKVKLSELFLARIFNVRQFDKGIMKRYVIIYTTIKYDKSR